MIATVSTCRIRRWLLLSTLLAAIVTAGACADATQIAGQTFQPSTPGVLTVATSLPAPGFWEGDDPDQLTGGFEYVLAQRLAERWGLDLRVIDVPFDDLVAGDLHGADLAMSQITITDERRRLVSFSTPYYHDDDGAVLPAGEQLTDLKTAKEQRWGAVADSTQLDLLVDVVRPDDDPLPVPGTDAAIEAVVSGQIDAVLLDLATALVASNERDDITTGGRIVVVDGDMAAVLPTDGPNREVVDAAIRAFTSDRTIATLIGEHLSPHFERPPDSVPVIRLPE